MSLQNVLIDNYKYNFSSLQNVMTVIVTCVGRHHGLQKRHWYTSGHICGGASLMSTRSIRKTPSFTATRVPGSPPGEPRVVLS